MSSAYAAERIETMLEWINLELGIPLFPARQVVCTTPDRWSGGRKDVSRVYWHIFGDGRMPGYSACGKARCGEADPRRMPKKITFTCSACFMNCDDVDRETYDRWIGEVNDYLKIR